MAESLERQDGSHGPGPKLAYSASCEPNNVDKPDAGGGRTATLQPNWTTTDTHRAGTPRNKVLAMWKVEGGNFQALQEFAGLSVADLTGG